MANRGWRAGRTGQEEGEGGDKTGTQGSCGDVSRRKLSVFVNPAGPCGEVTKTQLSEDNTTQISEDSENKVTCQKHQKHGQAK